MTLTQRQVSIKKLELLEDSIPYEHWKDFRAQIAHLLPPKSELEGLTDEEYSILAQGDSCPRWASDVMHRLYEEIEDVEFPKKLDLVEAIRQAEKLLKGLKAMLRHPSDIIESYYSVGAQIFCDSEIKVDDVTYESDMSYLGDGSMCFDRRKLKISLEIELRDLSILE